MCWSWEVSLTFSIFEFITLFYLLYRNKYIDRFWVIFLTPIAIQEFCQFVTWKWGIDDDTTLESCNNINFIFSRITLIITHPLPVLLNLIIVKTIWKGSKKWIQMIWKCLLVYHTIFCIILIVSELLDNKYCVIVGDNGHLEWFEIIQSALYYVLSTPYYRFYVGVIVAFWSVPQALAAFLYRPQWIMCVPMVYSVTLFITLFATLGTESFSVYCWSVSFFSLFAILYVPMAPFLLSKYSKSDVEQDGNCVIKFFLTGAHEHYQHYTKFEGNNTDETEMNEIMEYKQNKNKSFHIKRYGEEQRISLFQWNIMAAFLHLIQSIIYLIVALKVDDFKQFKLPIDTYFLSYSSSLVTSSKNVGVVQLAPLVFIFFLLSAMFHILVILPYVNDVYWDQINRGKNYFRWIEYSVSCTIMIWLIAMLFGVTNISLLITIGMTNTTMNILCLMQEKYNNIRDPNCTVDWLPFYVACLIGIASWIVIYIYLASATRDTQSEIPLIVYSILITYFCFFNTFPINMILQYKRIGPWKDYIFGEVVYIILSLLSKTSLAWLLFAALNQQNKYNIAS